MRETAPSELPITPEQAKAKVFEHWYHLDALAKRRFPKDENLAHEALLYVLKNLEADDWRRVCTWRRSAGQSHLNFCKINILNQLQSLLLARC
jgi:hypothetical protein